MGGEGSMMAANQSLKNNRSQLKRKDRKALGGSYAGIELKDFPKATDEQLQAVKDKIVAQNKRTMGKNIVILCVLIGVFILLFTLI